MYVVSRSNTNRALILSPQSELKKTQNELNKGFYDKYSEYGATDGHRPSGKTTFCNYK